jgi:hypothetical protein
MIKARHWQLTSVILATQEAAWANSSQDSISKNTITKNWAGGMAHLLRMWRSGGSQFEASLGKK